MNANDHLNIFKDIGGISLIPAILPTIKFPDQNKAAKKSNIVAKIMLFFFCTISLDYYKKVFLTKPY